MYFKIYSIYHLLLIQFIDENIDKTSANKQKNHKRQFSGVKTKFTKNQRLTSLGWIQIHNRFLQKGQTIELYSNLHVRYNSTFSA